MSDIIMYDTPDVPQTKLEELIDPNEFHSADEIRRILLDNFPQEKRDPLSGIEYIADSYLDDPEIAYRQKANVMDRETLVTDLIPGWDGSEEPIYIGQTQVYECCNTGRKAKIAVELVPTNEGYAVGNRIFNQWTSG